jgi:hypothetical protein
MTKLAETEKAAAALSETEFSVFRDWFEAFQARRSTR